MYTVCRNSDTLAFGLSFKTISKKGNPPDTQQFENCHFERKKNTPLIPDSYSYLSCFKKLYIDDTFFSAGVMLAKNTAELTHCYVRLCIILTTMNEI